MQPMYRMKPFVTVEGNGRGRSNAYIAGSGVDVGADIFARTSTSRKRGYGPGKSCTRISIMQKAA